MESSVWVYNTDFWEQRARREESYRQGDLSFIMKMNPPQILGSACDFSSYANPNYLQLTIPPKTDNSLMIIFSTNNPTQSLETYDNPPRNPPPNSTLPEKTENGTDHPHPSEVNGKASEVSGNQTQV